MLRWSETVSLPSRYRRIWLLLSTFVVLLAALTSTWVVVGGLLSVREGMASSAFELERARTTLARLRVSTSPEALELSNRLRSILWADVSAVRGTLEGDARRSGLQLASDAVSRESLSDNVAQHVLRLSANGPRESVSQWMQGIVDLYPRAALKDVRLAAGDAPNSVAVELTVVVFVGVLP